MSLSRIRDWICNDTNQLPLKSDDVFRALGDRRRREALVVLEAHGGELPLEVLAREVAAQEEGVAVGDVDREAYQRVRIALYQSHLIVLDDLGVLEWDADAGVVAPRAPASVLATIVDDVARRCGGEGRL